MIDDKTKWVIEQARRVGPMEVCSYRVVVVHPDDRVTHQDFRSLDEARQYADDVASEGEYPPLLAYVLDSGFAVVDVGKHYGTRGNG